MMGARRLWGARSFSACAVLQARVVEQAQEGPNLASTLNISAFNIGNAFGAGLGGWALDHGLFFAGIPWLAAVPALGALAVTMISIFKEQRTRSLTLRHLKAQFSRDEATEDFPMLATLKSTPKS
jgi:DHA1 family inner membrane transport protein